jgi:hypothetical protein
MGIDYIVDLDCKPKQALTVEKMVALVKGQNQASLMIEMARRDGDRRPPEQISFTRVIMRPEGPEEEEVSVGVLLKQVAELANHAPHCQGCKANLLGKPFGCYGSIPYPIPAAAEEWLMSLLAEDLKSPAGYLLRSAVKDFGYDGGMFLDMRPQDMFFERRSPVKRKWGSWFSGWSLTSDQLLQMLFGLGNLQPAHCQMMCIILGMLQTEDAADPLPSPPEEAEPLAQAINAMALASQLEVNLLIDA